MRSCKHAANRSESDSAGQYIEGDGADHAFVAIPILTEQHGPAQSCQGYAGGNRARDE